MHGTRTMLIALMFCVGNTIWQTQITFELITLMSFLGTMMIATFADTDAPVQQPLLSYYNARPNKRPRYAYENKRDYFIARRMYTIAPRAEPNLDVMPPTTKRTRSNY